MGDVIELLADLRSKLYVGTESELKEVVKKIAPVFESEGKSRAEVLSVIEKYLVNLDKEPDKGVGVLTELCDLLKVKPKIKVDPTLYSLKKDFKISGNIGESANCIGYTSFLRQVESGTAKGYTDRDIIDAIIRAIQAGSKLRGYLEGRDDLTLSVVQAIIRGFYREKSSTELYQELCSLKQNGQESTQEFLFRSLELRQKIRFSSKESGAIKYDNTLVDKQFKHSLTTGIREESIRLEFKSLLDHYDKDEELIEKVNELERQQEERNNKFKAKKVSKLSAEESTETLENKIMKELKTLRAEVNALKKTDTKTERSAAEGKSSVPRKRKSCPNCAGTDRRCVHCWKCGGSDHLQRRCPENIQGSLRRGEDQ